MLLHKLYLEPQVFEPVEFKTGINFVYAKKDSSQGSLNGVGKSLLLNLVDFCLLSTESEHIKSAKANNDLEQSFAVLEFYVDEELYIIKRPFKSSARGILFGKKENDLDVYNNRDLLARILCDLIFKDDLFSYKYSNQWLRKLIPFFIKAQSGKSKINFSDPISYLIQRPEIEVIIYHLFLLGLNNKLFSDNLQTHIDLKLKKSTHDEVEKLVKDLYALDPDTVDNEISKIRQQVKKYEAHIENFKLMDQYEDVEQESNKLTEKLKSLLLENYNDRKRLDAYKASFATNETVNTKKVAKVYRELNDLLGNSIQKTLDEALEFRQNLMKSRRNFLTAEIDATQKMIDKREHKMAEIEESRAKLFKFLESKGAIQDLSEAYLDLNAKKEKLSNIEGRVRVLKDLKREVAEVTAHSKKIYADIETEMNSLHTIKILDEFRSVFFELTEAVYGESAGAAKFNFTTAPAKDSNLKVDVSLPGDLAFGMNRGRTLVYDLTLLLYRLRKNFKGPKFLIHDGIFDGMDRSHFFALYKFLTNEAKKTPFQYIITLNKEGEVKDVDFGEGAEELTSGGIETEAIKTLTPQKPLFGHNWN